MRMKTWMAALVVGVITVLAAGSVWAAMMTAAQQRSVVMKGMGGHMKALGAVAKGEASVDASTLVHAMAVHELSVTIVHLFPAGSGGGDSRAKPEIWQQWDKFTMAADALADATPGLVEAAKTGDAKQIGAALGDVGKACGGCHKPFRAEKKS